MDKLCFTAKISTTIVINPTTIVVDQIRNGTSTHLAFWAATRKARPAKATKQPKQQRKVDIEKLLDKVKHLNDGVIDPDLEIMVRRGANQHRNLVWATVKTLEVCFKSRILSNCPSLVNQKRSLIYSAIDSCLEGSQKEDTTKRSPKRQQASKKSANDDGGDTDKQLPLFSLN